MRETQAVSETMARHLDDRAHLTTQDSISARPEQPRGDPLASPFSMEVVFSYVNIAKCDFDVRLNLKTKAVTHLDLWHHAEATGVF